MDKAGVSPVTREFLSAFAEHARQQGSAIENLKYGSRGRASYTRDTVEGGAFLKSRQQ